MSDTYNSSGRATDQLSIPVKQNKASNPDAGNVLVLDAKSAAEIGGMHVQGAQPVSTGAIAFTTIVRNAENTNQPSFNIAVFRTVMENGNVCDNFESRITYTDDKNVWTVTDSEGNVRSIAYMLRHGFRWEGQNYPIKTPSSLPLPGDWKRVLHQVCS